MIDFHTHILPQMDDGSSSVEMSLRLCAMLKEQGIGIAAATPHFYASGKESIPAFLARRDAAFAQLQDAMGADGLRLLRGAEVGYYDGMYASEDLRKLCLEGTNLLLVEMPFSEWPAHVLHAFAQMHDKGLQVVLAHIDRYLFQKDRVFDTLSDMGVLFQMNADALLHISPRRKLLRMFQRGQIAFLGSDCHNDTTRAPKIGEAVQLLRTKLGEDAIGHLESAESFFITDRERAQ